MYNGKALYTAFCSLIWRKEKMPELSDMTVRASARTQYAYTTRVVSMQIKARKIAHVTLAMTHIHQGAVHAVVVISVVVTGDVLTVESSLTRATFIN